VTKRGYYLWDWYGTKTIKFDADICFHCDEYAKTQDCYRRFHDAKKAGIAALKYEIELAQAQLDALKKLTIKEVTL
jgi:hypothetical protein